jgi:hypothetical protein
MTGLSRRRSRVRVPSLTQIELMAVARGRQVQHRRTMGLEAGGGSTFARLLTPWGMMLEFVSFANGRKYIENRDQLLWSPVDPTA